MSYVIMSKVKQKQFTAQFNEYMTKVFLTRMERKGITFSEMVLELYGDSIDPDDLPTMEISDEEAMRIKKAFDEYKVAKKAGKLTTLETQEDFDEYFRKIEE